MRLRPGRIGLYAVAIVLVLWSVFPLYYAIVTSFASGTQMFVPNYWPRAFDLSNYGEVFGRGNMGPALLNSVAVAGATTLAALVMALFAAFAFSRVRFRGRKLLLLTILSTTMFPQVAILAGLYELMTRLGLYNSIWAVMFSYMILVLPFSVWIMTAFMRNLPSEIEDVAIIDGASPRIIVTRIFLPLMWPGIVATGLVALTAAWNEFLFAFTLTVTPDHRTVPVAIQLIWGYTPHDTPWGTIMAACVVASAPMIALALFFQRRMVSGLTAGGVSG